MFFILCCDLCESLSFCSVTYDTSVNCQWKHGFTCMSQQTVVYCEGHQVLLVVLNCACCPVICVWMLLWGVWIHSCTSRLSMLSTQWEHVTGHENKTCCSPSFTATIQHFHASFASKTHPLLFFVISKAWSEIQSIWWYCYDSRHWMFLQR